jgi:hypothetical protein
VHRHDDLLSRIFSCLKGRPGGIGAFRIDNDRLTLPQRVRKAQTQEQPTKAQEPPDADRLTYKIDQSSCGENWIRNSLKAGKGSEYPESYSSSF